jgi:chromosomal replication initiation ATPase DnaA
MELGMGELIKYRARRPRPLTPQSRRRIERLRRDPEAFTIVACAAQVRGISLKDLLQGGQNRRHILLSRQLAMYLVHVLLGRSQQEVGLLFCRSHATVSYACKNIETLRDEREFEAEIEWIERELEGPKLPELSHVA